jgi:hypothetical protein
MAKRRGSRKEKKTRRGRRGRSLRGGGLGQSYTFGPTILPGVDTGPGAVPMSSCMAEVRPGSIPTPTTGLGLPGLSGGARGAFGVGRRHRRNRRTQRRVNQMGGRYSFDLAASTEFGGTPWGSGIPQVVRIPCEGSTPNPLNPGPHTPSTQPPIQGGGAGGIDSAFYAAPTAGYENKPSTWVGSTGAPSLLQIPYEARTMNPACLKTGGGRRRGKRSGTRRTRKH